MTARSDRFRTRSARVRLAAMYAAVVLASGAALLALLYALFQVNLAIRPLDASELDCRPVAAPAGATRPAPTGPDPSPSPGFAIECRPSANAGPGEDSGTSEPPAASEAQLALPATAALSTVILDAALGRLAPVAGLSLAAFALTSLVLGWWLAGRALRPVESIAAAAHRLSDSTLHERIHLQTQDREFVELAGTINAMLDRLEDAFDAQRDFAANASHELRTPLAIARAELDVTLDDPAASIDDLRRMGQVLRETNERSGRVIEALLTLARTGQRLSSGTVELDALVHDALDRHRPAITARGQLVAEHIASASVEGDAALLERLIENLVGNAVIHNVDGGTIAVSTVALAGRATVVVENSGRIIDATDVELLFERFHRRSDPRTPGLGLGLSIAAAIVRAHNGRIDASPRPTGGLVVRVDLPAANVRDPRSQDQVDGRSPASGLDPVAEVRESSP